MTGAGELERLAERVEAATGADRELDELIAMAIGRKLYDGFAFYHAPPAYSASLDAAMTLADDMLLVAMSDIAGDGLPAVCLCSDTSTSPPVEHWGIALASGSRREQLARAFCAAALRARAQQVRA